MVAVKYGKGKYPIVLGALSSVDNAPKVVLYYYM